MLRYSRQNLKAALNAAGDAPIYACRAWCSFNGNTGSINAGGNVSSITDNGVGDYTVNFDTAIEDNSYSAVCNVNNSSAGGRTVGVWTRNTSSVRLYCRDLAAAAQDSDYVSLVIFR